VGDVVTFMFQFIDPFDLVHRIRPFPDRGRKGLNPFQGRGRMTLEKVEETLLLGHQPFQHLSSRGAKGLVADIQDSVGLSMGWVQDLIDLIKAPASSSGSPMTGIKKNGFSEINPFI